MSIVSVYEHVPVSRRNAFHAASWRGNSYQRVHGPLQHAFHDGIRQNLPTAARPPRVERQIPILDLADDEDGVLASAAHRHPDFLQGGLDISAGVLLKRADDRVTCGQARVEQLWKRLEELIWDFQQGKHGQYI